MRGLIDSTPLRLSLVLAALFAIVSLASLGATYAVVRAGTLDALRTTLRQETAGLAALPGASDVLRAVEARDDAGDRENGFAAYRAPGGAVAGPASVLPADAWVGERWLRPDGEGFEDDYLALARPVHGGLLLLAASIEPLDELRDAFLAVLLFNIVPTTLIVVGGGALIARRSAHAMRQIDDALGKLSGGDYAARVDLGARARGDLGRIGGRIDAMATAQERQVAALRQVSADIAHDLKTPIQRVSVLLDRLAEGGALEPEGEELVARARTETEAIVRTFQALLQIAQVEGGSPKARFAPVDLAALAATLVEVYAPAAEESGHRLRIGRSDEGARVMGDRTLLGQVLANLIENALRHTAPGTEIVVDVARGEGGVRLAVADRGPGIPAHEREPVLRRLYRLERSRTTPGSGLGLSLVAAIADLHDAVLSLEDAAPGLRVVLDFAQSAPSRDAA